eukprot:s751_g6.t1
MTAHSSSVNIEGTMTAGTATIRLTRATSTTSNPSPSATTAPACKGLDVGAEDLRISNWVVRFAVLEQRSVISSHVESQAVESGSSSPSTAQLRAAQLRALMLEDRVAELRSAVYELQSRLTLL